MLSAAVTWSPETGGRPTGEGEPAQPALGLQPPRPLTVVDPRVESALELGPILSPEAVARCVFPEARRLYFSAATQPSCISSLGPEQLLRSACDHEKGRPGRSGEARHSRSAQTLPGAVRTLHPPAVTGSRFRRLRSGVRQSDLCDPMRNRGSGLGAPHEQNPEVRAVPAAAVQMCRRRGGGVLSVRASRPRSLALCGAELAGRRCPRGRLGRPPPRCVWFTMTGPRGHTSALQRLDAEVECPVCERPTGQNTGVTWGELAVRKAGQWGF